MKPVDVIVIVAGRAVLRPSSARVPSDGPNTRYVTGRAP